MIQAMGATRRTFIGRSAAAAGLAAVPGLVRAGELVAQDARGGPPGAPAAVTDVHAPLPPGAVKLGGFLGRRLDDCIRSGIGAQDVAALVAPFRVRDETWSWRTEFWGKWFTSAAWAWRYNQDPALRRKLDEAVAGLLATQTPDGYIGTYREEARLSNWDVWGRKYVLLGLLAHHDLTGDAAALAAAARSADYLLQTDRSRGGSAASTTPAAGTGWRRAPSSSRSCGSTAPRARSATWSSPGGSSPSGASTTARASWTRRSRACRSSTCSRSRCPRRRATRTTASRRPTR